MMIGIRICLVFVPLAGLLPAGAAQYSGVPTIAIGVNWNSTSLASDGRSAVLTTFDSLAAVTVSPAGPILLAGGGRIRQIGLDGLVSTLAVDSGMDPFPKLTADRLGNIYYSSFQQIRKVTPGGTNVRIAGFGQTNAREGMAATSANLFITGIVVNANSEILLSDMNTYMVWRIDSGGALHAVAGTGTPGGGGVGGPATSAQLFSPADLAYDASGALYINDGRILKLRADGTLIRYDGNNSVSPLEMTVDPAGNVYFIDSRSQYQIRRLGADGTLVTFAGTGEDAYSNGCSLPGQTGTGDAKTAKFGPITSLATDPAGNLLVVDQSEYVLRQITPAGGIRTIAGKPSSFSGDGGPAAAASLSRPHGLAVDSSGNIYVADTANNRIRQVTPDGNIQTIAGNDGPTSDSSPCTVSGANILNAPEAVAADAAGNLYIADTGNHRLMKLAADGTLILFAGTGHAGFQFTPPGVPANSIPLNAPRAVGVDQSGNVYVGDNALRTLKIAPDGTIVKVLPNLRARSFGADGNGNLYMTSALVAYQVTAGDGLIPLAGLGTSQVSLTNPPAAEGTDSEDLTAGSGITRDASGTIYTIANSTLSVISPACHIETLPSGGGFDTPIGAEHVALSAQGDVLLSDAVNNVVWRLPHLVPQPGEQPTPQLAIGAPVMNVASMLVATNDVVVTTSPGVTQTVRFVTSDPIAPGEIVRITGQCLGPFNTVDEVPDVNGGLPVTLGGTQVSFNGMAAALLSVQAGSIVAITPLGLPVGVNVPMVVQTGGVQVTKAVPTVQFLPGLYRSVELDGSETVIAVNQDGTLNASSNPAPAGSVVSFYGTGFGQTSPPMSDGQPPSINETYAQTVAVTINNVPANVEYAGPLPGYAGMTQINVQVPATTTGPVQIQMGSAPFRQTVRLWIM